MLRVIRLPLLWIVRDTRLSVVALDYLDCCLPEIGLLNCAVYTLGLVTRVLRKMRLIKCVKRDYY